MEFHHLSEEVFLQHLLPHMDIDGQHHVHLLEFYLVALEQLLNLAHLVSITAPEVATVWIDEINLSYQGAWSGS